MVRDLKREYQIARRVEAMIDADDADTPDRYHVDDDYWDTATKMLEAEEKGGLMRYLMVVVLKDVTTSAMDSGRYHYRAVQEKDAPEIKGCRHPVDSMSLHWAGVEAIAIHQQTCVGRS
jgi:hypothetical protein